MKDHVKVKLELDLDDDTKEYLGNYAKASFALSEAIKQIYDATNDLSEADKYSLIMSLCCSLATTSIFSVTQDKYLQSQFLADHIKNINENIEMFDNCLEA